MALMTWKAQAEPVGWRAAHGFVRPWLARARVPVHRRRPGCRPARRPRRQRHRRLVAPGGLAADRHPRHAPAQRHRHDLRHQRATGSRPAGSSTTSGIRAPAWAAAISCSPTPPDRSVLQRADRPAAEQRRVPGRRRQLERHGHHRAGEQRLAGIRPGHQDHDAGAGHEPAALVRHAHHPAQRGDLHPGRTRGCRPGRGPRRRRQPAPAVGHGHVRPELVVPAQLGGAQRQDLRRRQPQDVSGRPVRARYADPRRRHAPERPRRHHLERGDVRARQDPARRRRRLSPASATIPAAPPP